MAHVRQLHRHEAVDILSFKKGTMKLQATLSSLTANLDLYLNLKKNRDS